MSEFRRYAVYYLPDDAGLAGFGASWLGWDVAGGVPVEQPEIEGIAEATAAPRRYGFHGTLKPPFFLADGAEFGTLEAEVADLAGRLAPVRLDGLRLAAIGRFLALVPEGGTRALGDLAFACVRDLDGFRRPPDAAELARRRAAGLTERQESLLTEWGYPYVGDEFRFHLTLTGKLDPTTQARFSEALKARLPDLPRPFDISSIALVGEGEDGQCRLIHRYALTG